MPLCGACLVQAGDGREGFPAAGCAGGRGIAAARCRGAARRLGPLLSGCTVRPRRTGELHVRRHIGHGFIDRDGNFTTINDPKAGTASGQGTSVGFINDFGQVTGSYIDSNGNTVAFAGPLGRFTTVNDPLAPPFSTFTAAINDAGVVAGEYLDANETFHGFTEVHGVFTPVEDPAGTEGTNVAGISNLGVIIGFYADSSGNLHGFELSPAR
jgi:hypothetical protein